MAYPSLRLRLVAGPDARLGVADSVALRLSRLGVAPARVEVRRVADGGLCAAFVVAPGVPPDPVANRVAAGPRP